MFGRIVIRARLMIWRIQMGANMPTKWAMMMSIIRMMMIRIIGGWVLSPSLREMPLNVMMMVSVLTDLVYFLCKVHVLKLVHFVH
jgi:hypothetical protein